MKIGFLVCAFLLLGPATSIAQSPCVFVAMGGDLAWISLLGNLIGQSTDIAIQTDAAVRAEARRTDCTQVSLNNDDEAGFLRQIRELGRRYPAQRYHLAFTGHNFTGSLRPLEAPLIVGDGHETTFGRFLDALKQGLPSGSRVTFHSNTCFPMMSEAVIAKRLDAEFDICGSASSVPWRASYNYRKPFDYDGRRFGAYGVIGLQQWHPNRPLDVAGFHLVAKKGDAGNSGKQPGLTTSQAFALATLQEKFPRRKQALGVEDLDARLNQVHWQDGPLLADFLARPADDVLQEMQTAPAAGRAPSHELDPARHYVRNAYALFTGLHEVKMDLLPQPYLGQVVRAKAWIDDNRSRLLSQLVRIAREKARFVQENAPSRTGKAPERDPAWDALEAAHALSLHDYKVEFRILQEGQLVQEFMLAATPAERRRYLKLVACESRPLF